MESKFFTSEKLFDNVTLIRGLAGENCYLIEGGEKAMLIDSLTGAGSLKAFVRELTDLPVVLVNTHGHGDHCGGNFEFSRCYIHPADIPTLYDGFGKGVEGRHAFVMEGKRAKEMKNPPTLEDMVPTRPMETFPLNDGDVFDLGGVRLEVIEVPGHTKGTVVLLDRDRRVVYSGDACNANTLLCTASSVTVEEYREGLLHFQRFLPCFDGMYGGHSVGLVPKVILEEALELCDEILEGRDSRVELASRGRPCYYAKPFHGDYLRDDGKLANIAYTLDRIRK